jgi:hypothetical protein
MKKPEERRTITKAPKFNKREHEKIEAELKKTGLSFPNLIMKMINSPLKDAVFVGDRVGGSILFNNKIWRPVD